LHGGNANIAVGARPLFLRSRSGFHRTANGIFSMWVAQAGQAGATKTPAAEAAEPPKVPAGKIVAEPAEVNGAASIAKPDNLTFQRCG
jgi:hypothetical protein